MRLYDKRVTEEEITKESLKTPPRYHNRRQIPLTVFDAARTPGYTRNILFFYVKKVVEKFWIVKCDNRRRIRLSENIKDKMHKGGDCYPSPSELPDNV